MADIEASVADHQVAKFKEMKEKLCNNNNGSSDKTIQ